MKSLAWEFLLIVIPVVLLIAVIIEISYEQGYKVGRSTKPTLIERIEHPQDTDKMCTQWLFEANMKEVRKRVCKGE